MKRRFSLFTYPVMDVKAAEADLNRRAAAGWRLEKIWLGLLASFVPAEVPVSYCLDWYDPKREDSMDYRALLADAGWRSVGQLAYWNIYEAPVDTAPIQTDGALEYRRFRKKALRRMAIGCAVPLLCLTLLALLGILAAIKLETLDWRILVMFLTNTNIGALLIVLLPLMLVGGGLWLGRWLLRLGQWRRAVAQEEPFPVPGRGSALVARLLVLAGDLILAAPMVLAVLLDAMSGSLNLGWMAGTILGCLIILTRDQGIEHQRNRRYAKRMIACVVVLLALRLLPLSDAAGLVCVRPPLADGHLLTERTDAVTLETHATLLSARTERYESGPLAEEGSAHGSVESEAWALPWTRLADWVTEQYRKELGAANQEALPGYKDVWLARYGISGGDYLEGRTRDIWLIRRGNTVLWVETDMGPLDEQWLDEILARLEGG